jgi:glycosyltransferase involved in cell wall biosynthesis
MHSDSLRICALVPYPPGTTPSQRYRIEQWMPYLAEEGITVDLMPFADGRMLELLHQPGHRLGKVLAGTTRFLHRFRDLARVRRYDIVLVHRALCIAGPAVLERILALLGRPVIFDFDDAIFLLHTTEANRHLGWLKFPGKTAAICRSSTHVVVGNSYLGDYARQYNRQVTVIPTSVDTDRIQPRVRAASDGRVVIGWTGSSTSQTYLEMFTPVLRQIMTNAGIEFRVHSDRAPALPGVPFVWRPWSSETEVEEIGAFDIGVMPMPDDDWARGKCAMKALLYMAMGIPAICSAVGANREVIVHGENGLLATSNAEWVENLQLLIARPDLREKLGYAGRRTVEEQYSMRRSAGRFAQVVRETVAEWRLTRESSQWDTKSYKSSAR